MSGGREPLDAAMLKTRGRHELILHYAGHPGQFGPAAADELRSMANAETGNPHRSHRLRQIERTTREAIEAATQFSAVSSFEGFVSWLSLHKEGFITGFRPLLRAVGDRAASEPLGDLAKGIRLALTQYARLDELLAALNRWAASRGDPAILAQEPGLLSPAFRRWLGLQAEAAIPHAPAQAMQSLRVRERLSYLAIAREKGVTVSRDAARPGRVLLRSHMPDAAAQIWYLFDQEAVALFDSEGQPLKEKPGDYADVWARVARRAPQRSAERCLFLASFARYSLHAFGPRVAPPALARFRELIDDYRLEPEARATLVLRYGMALTLFYRRVGEPRHAVEDALRLLRAATKNVSEAGSPRLLRDLWFTIGRLEQDRMGWDAKALPSAEDAFRRGLAVRAVEHERDARGRALADLANTILQRGLDRARDEAALATYAHALAHLPPEEFPFARAVVLNNLAAYHQERPFGDSGVNREQALALADEGLALLAQVTEETEEAMQPLLRQARAAILLTRGNVLRSRSYGDADRQLDASIQSYHDGLRELADTSHELAWLLRINLAIAHRQRWESTSDESNLADAERSLDAAGSAISGDGARRFAALADIERGRLVLADPASAPSIFGGIADGLAGHSVPLGESGMPSEGAELERVRGLLLERAERLTEADLALASAGERFERLGDLSEAARVARRRAGIAVGIVAGDPRGAPLEAAESLLEGAAAHVERLRLRYDSSGWRLGVALEFSGLVPDLLWCRARLGRPAERLWEGAASAKNREFLMHVAGFGRGALEEPRSLDVKALRLEARAAEFASMPAAPEYGDLPSHWPAAEEQLNSADERYDTLRLLGWDDAPLTGAEALDLLRREQQAHPGTVVLDFNVSSWGTVVMVRCSDGSDRVCAAPLTRSRLRELLWNPSDGWCTLYRTPTAAETAPPPLDVFEASIARTVGALEGELMRPALAGLVDELRGRRVLIVPGALSGLPLHLCDVDPHAREPLFELVGGLAYVPTLAVLPTTTRQWNAPGRVLCLLSSPDGEGVAPLDNSPAEIATIATAFAAAGARVEVIASKGTASGKAVFGPGGHVLPANVTVADGRPTPETVFRRIADPGLDVVYFAGHGLADALVLVDGEGKLRKLRSIEILAADDFEGGPLIHLSACENAFEDAAGSGESLSFVAALLRRGASVVVGSLWHVYESASTWFARELHRELLAGTEVSVATRRALCEVKRLTGRDVARYGAFITYFGSNKTRV